MNNEIESLKIKLKGCLDVIQAQKEVIDSLSDCLIELTDILKETLNK
jgi:hypothetical protein